MTSDTFEPQPEHRFSGKRCCVRALFETCFSLEEPRPQLVEAQYGRTRLVAKSA